MVADTTIPILFLLSWRRIFRQVKRLLQSSEKTPHPGGVRVTQAPYSLAGQGAAKHIFHCFRAFNELQSEIFRGVLKTRWENSEVTLRIWIYLRD